MITVVLQPENIFVAYQQDGSPCLKLADFGISRSLVDGQSTYVSGPAGVLNLLNLLKKRLQNNTASSA